MPYFQSSDYLGPDLLLGHLRSLLGVVKPRIHKIPFSPGEPLTILSLTSPFLTVVLTQKICYPLTTMRVMLWKLFG